MKKLLFITWSISYGYRTEKSLADVLNRIDTKECEISILPLFKNSDSTIFNSNIKIMESLIDYTSENFNEQEALNNYYKLLVSTILKGEAKIIWIRGDCASLIILFSMSIQTNKTRA